MQDVLLGAGVPENISEDHRYWVNFASADEPSEGTHETCISLHYAVDRRNVIILAQFMNDEPLLPDHVATVRTMILEHVSSRCVKKL